MKGATAICATRCIKDINAAMSLTFKRNTCSILKHSLINFVVLPQDHIRAVSHTINMLSVFQNDYESNA